MSKAIGSVGRYIYKFGGMLLAIVVSLFFASTANAAGETEFTLAVVPDTQQEVMTDTNPLLPSRYTWLTQNKDILNLKFITHTGDLVNWGVVDPIQFTRASNATNILDASGIPYGYALGNHDTAAVQAGGSAAPGNVRTNLRNTSAYNSYFPISRFKNVAGYYELGKVDNMYQTFNAGGVDWLNLSLEMWPRQGVVDWAKQVVASHPNYNVFLSTHAFTDETGAFQTTGIYGDLNAQQVWDQLISQYPNIKFTVSGHYKGANYIERTGVNGNKVPNIMTAYHSNYQNHVRLLKINTANGTISSSVYVSKALNGYPTGAIHDAYSDFVTTDMQWVRPADTIAPSVSVTSPADGTTTNSSSVTLSADATDNVGVSKVVFSVNGVDVNEDTTAPYSYNFDTTTSPDGTYAVTARAYDAAGNVTTSQPVSFTLSRPADTTAPVVSLTAPTDGATLSDSTTTLTATASDNVGVTKVEFYADGAKLSEVSAAPYSYVWDTSAATDGTHTLTARAYDAAGNVSDSTVVNVTIQHAPAPDTTAPVVSITSPTAGQTIGTNTVSIQAVASDNVGVTKVEFYVNGALVGQSATAPYQYTWDTSAQADGNYTLTAKAYDAAGNVTTSSTVALTLDGVFTIAVIPDTRQEVMTNGTTTNSILMNARNQWLVNQKSALDLRFVAHAGNMTNWGVADPNQFVQASNAMNILGNAYIPYVSAVGLNDTAAVTTGGGAAAGSSKTNFRNTATFNQYFPTSRFTSVGGVFEPGKSDNLYQTFTAGGTKWLVLSLESWPRATALAWAKQVVAANPDANIIINTSVFLSSDGTLSTATSFGDTSPASVWSQLVSQYPNIKLVVSDYNKGSLHVESTGAAGNQVEQVLTSYKSNYTNEVRVLEINTKLGTIKSSVYVSRDTRGTAPGYLTDAASAWQIGGMSWVK